MNGGIINAAILEGFKLELFPNPASRILNIQLNGTGAEGEVAITDLTGKVVFTQKITASTSQLKVNVGGTDFANGQFHQPYWTRRDLSLSGVVPGALPD